MISLRLHGRLLVLEYIDTQDQHYNNMTESRKAKKRFESKKRLLPSLCTILVRSSTIPTFALQFSAILTWIRAKIPSSLSFAFLRAAFAAVPRTPFT